MMNFQPEGLEDGHCYIRCIRTLKQLQQTSNSDNLDATFQAIDLQIDSIIQSFNRSNKQKRWFANFTYAVVGGEIDTKTSQTRSSTQIVKHKFKTQLTETNFQKVLKEDIADLKAAAQAAIEANMRAAMGSNHGVTSNVVSAIIPPTPPATLSTPIIQSPKPITILGGSEAALANSAATSFRPPIKPLGSAPAVVLTSTVTTTWREVKTVPPTSYTRSYPSPLSAVTPMYQFIFSDFNPANIVMQNNKLVSPLAVTPVEMPVANIHAMESRNGLKVATPIGYPAYLLKRGDTLTAKLLASDMVETGSKQYHTEKQMLAIMTLAFWLRYNRRGAVKIDSTNIILIAAVEALVYELNSQNIRCSLMLSAEAQKAKSCWAYDAALSNAQIFARSFLQNLVDANSAMRVPLVQTLSKSENLYMPSVLGTAVPTLWYRRPQVTASTPVPEVGYDNSEDLSSLSP